MAEKQEIIRRPDFAGGGITDDEREQMKVHVQLWIGRAFRTTPIEPEKIGPAIHGIYAAADLKLPRVVLVPSPLVMAFAGGFAAAIWYLRKEGKLPADGTLPQPAALRDEGFTETHQAAGKKMKKGKTGKVAEATDLSIGAGLDTAVANAVDQSVTQMSEPWAVRAVRFAVAQAIAVAMPATPFPAEAWASYMLPMPGPDAAPASLAGTEPDWFALAGELVGKGYEKFAIECAKRWHVCYQGGNTWAPGEAFLTACRDILGLRLPEYEKYAPWEQAAIHGGFRWMHEEFCLVCDFPEVLKVDADNRPHCDDGPSHRWRDGWSLWHLEGIRVDEQLVLRPDTQTLDQINKEENQDLRAIRLARWPGGWVRFLRETKSVPVDERKNDVENTREALFRTPDGQQRLVVTCPTGRIFALGVPDTVKTCAEAQQWLHPRKVNVIART